MNIHVLSAKSLSAEPTVSVKINVSTAGLNARQPPGARELYGRLQTQSDRPSCRS
jgi:hypothetical protein